MSVLSKLTKKTYPPYFISNASYLLPTLSESCYGRGLGASLHSRKQYSTDDFRTSFAQMYEALRPIEERIISLNLERINETAQIDALVQRGLITPLTADFYRSKIVERANAYRQAQRYKNIFWYLGLPLIALTALNAYFMTSEEELHEHSEYVPYPHLRLRLKKFPWGDGDKTLFHNPEVNH